ncbi:unnamed protein product [Clonostachys solani]|uniref:Uncharacterized protein n=1 Tax=Clonostachys solani TaxID=160281 RepID=A0A9N9ZMD3_9HYPO|nr:unnamed protein product [Clonostachys solani]
MPESTGTVKLDAYGSNGYRAPDHCETCDVSVPDQEARRKHMEETSHRRCPLCKGYVPLGGFYTHAFIKHGDEYWNEHQVAFTDRQDLKNAKSWAVPKQSKDEE